MPRVAVTATSRQRDGWERPTKIRMKARAVASTCARRGHIDRSRPWNPGGSGSTNALTMDARASPSTIPSGRRSKGDSGMVRLGYRQVDGLANIQADLDIQPGTSPLQAVRGPLFDPEHVISGFSKRALSGAAH